MKSALLAYGLLASASTVTAHIQMSNPYPIRSPLDPNGDESKKDYSYTNPLDSDGSDYPCKGYANDPFRSVASYSPGGTYELDLQGSATHDGGSCQISLSYDTGKSFQVIHSMLGGCPLTESYKFTIPSDAPTGDALLTWTWFNKVGNREMYMNCAQVTIGDGSKKRDLEEIRKRDAFSSLPPIFIANVNGPGQCTTIENYDVNFPLPGPSVEGSINGTDAGFTCTGDAPFLHASGSGSSSSSSSGSGASSVKAAPVSTSKPIVSRPTVSTSKVAAHVASTPAASSSAKVVASSFGTEAARVATVATAAAHSNNDASVAGAAADDESARYVPGKPCVDGAIICGPGGTSWSMCSNGRPVHMGSVAAGMYCSHGAMQRLR